MDRRANAAEDGAMSSKIDMHIKPLAEWLADGTKLSSVDIVVFKGLTLIKLPNGEVRSQKRSNLYDGWAMNDDIRRAWCKLAGVKFSELKKAIAAYKKEQQAERLNGQLEHVRYVAAQHGYKLVKLSK
jgi:hypothetical protein